MVFINTTHTTHLLIRRLQLIHVTPGLEGPRVRRRELRLTVSQGRDHDFVLPFQRLQFLHHRAHLRTHRAHPCTNPQPHPGDNARGADAAVRPDLAWRGWQRLSRRVRGRGVR